MVYILFFYFPVYHVTSNFSKHILISFWYRILDCFPYSVCDYYNFSLSLFFCCFVFFLSGVWKPDTRCWNWSTSPAALVPAAPVPYLPVSSPVGSLILVRVGVVNPLPAPSSLFREVWVGHSHLAICLVSFPEAECAYRCPALLRSPSIGPVGGTAQKSLAELVGRAGRLMKKLVMEVYSVWGLVFLDYFE